VRLSRFSIGRLFAGAAVWFYALLLIIPVYYLLVSSVKSNTQIFADPFGLPTTWEFSNFPEAFDRVDLGSALLSSAVITGFAEIVTLILAIPAAHGLARAQGKLGVVMERIFALGFLIPGFAALVPTILLAILMKLYGNPLFLILFFPATAMPLSVILLAQFIRSIPPEIEEAAQMDGAGRLKTLVRVIIPMAAPGIATVAILNFLGFWNEYLFSLLILAPNPSLRTVQVALPVLVTQQSADYGLLAAGILMTLAPVYLLYLILQRQMENALIDGALK
jgi:multiple sugar transport system permease protein